MFVTRISIFKMNKKKNWTKFNFFKTLNKKNMNVLVHTPEVNNYCYSRVVRKRMILTNGKIYNKHNCF